MRGPSPNQQDKFVAMVKTRVEVDLRLSDFAPHTGLKVTEHPITDTLFRVIDHRNHLGSLDPDNVLHIMEVWREKAH